MHPMTTAATVLALSLALLSGAATARAGQDLAEEADINDGLLVIAVADKIRRACDRIGGRLFTARAYAGDLKAMAEARGYSEAEIDAYVNDKAEKAKMRTRRNAYFEVRGACILDPESLCALGQQEMNRGTQVGRLLRAK